jgi:hypothetical protein
LCATKLRHRDPRGDQRGASPLRFEVEGREILRALDAFEDEGAELGRHLSLAHALGALSLADRNINFAAGWRGC